MTRREYTAGSPTTLASAFNSGDTTFTITSATNWPTSADYDFFVTIDAGTAQEERVLCSARTGTTVTVATGGRGKDSTGEKNHAQGATVWPSWSAQDADEANAHIESTGYASFSKTVHGLGSGDGVVVGTDKTQTLTAKTINLTSNTLTGTKAQFNTAMSDADFTTLTGSETLTNKTLTSPVVTGGTLNGGDALTVTSTELNILDGITASTAELNILDGVTASAAELNKLDGATLSTAELNYVDGVTSSIQTQLDAKATSSALASHEADTTSIHGITDTSKLAKFGSSAAGRTIFVQTTTPTALATGDIWIDY